MQTGPYRPFTVVDAGTAVQWNACKRMLSFARRGGPPSSGGPLLERGDPLLQPTERFHPGRKLPDGCGVLLDLRAELVNLDADLLDAHPELADRFIDVQYPELIADPEATVRRVYQKLGVDLQEKAAARMRHLAANRRRYANGRGTRPTLAEFGLDARTEVRRFENYCSRFSIACS
jgi:hypothetical protein